MQLRQVVIVIGLTLAIFGETARAGYAARIIGGRVVGTDGSGRITSLSNPTVVEETFTSLGYLDKIFNLENSGGSTINNFTIKVKNSTQTNWNGFSFAILGSNPPTFLQNPAPGSTIFGSRQFSSNNTQLSWSNGVVIPQGEVTFTFSIALPDNLPGNQLVIRETPVPEPMTTLLGSGLALGFGGLLKREYSRKQKKLKDKKIS